MNFKHLVFAKVWETDEMSYTFLLTITYNI